jgi:anaerobic selenocysteine-containing dehydrogenase
VGVCQTETGSVTHWLINLLNILTGHFDEPGGAMFTTPPVDIKDIGKLGRIVGAVGNGNFTQRTTGLPDMNGELPVAGLADEITTPGKGQVRGMLVYAGNPVLSTPGGSRLEKAMEELEFCVSVDMYVNETNRHADVILPPVSQLERDDLDIVFPAVSVRNHIRFSPAAVPKPKDGREDWQILTDLTRRLGAGGGLRGRIEGALGQVTTRLANPERFFEVAIATGPYGVLRKGPLKGLTVAKIKKAKQGIDLGPLQSRMPGLLETPGKKVRLAPPVLVEAAGELDQIASEREAALSNGFDLTLIGRRQLRSNNSWMHNSARLMKGDDRCTAILHPDDAAARGLAEGASARVTSSVGSIELPVEISDEMRPGVISIPHGFGHHRAGVGWTRAASKPGVSVNDITDPKLVDRVSGNAALNSVPVRVEAVGETAEPERELAAATT